mmetsp:Transcript_46206/g.108241  ORF Transcript_46206/g.108241 Transcript_46206/m.108241 type:complete len:418 (+) Transcript_46206:78-1331(+)
MRLPGSRLLCIVFVSALAEESPGLRSACHRLVASVAEVDDMYLAALCRAHLGGRCTELLNSLGERPWGLEAQEAACEENEKLLAERSLLQGGTDGSSTLDETVTGKPMANGTEPVQGVSNFEAAPGTDARVVQPPTLPGADVVQQAQVPDGSLAMDLGSETSETSETDPTKDQVQEATQAVVAAIPKVIPPAMAAAKSILSVVTSPPSELQKFVPSTAEEDPLERASSALQGLATAAAAAAGPVAVRTPSESSGAGSEPAVEASSETAVRAAPEPPEEASPEPAEEVSSEPAASNDMTAASASDAAGPAGESSEAGAQTDSAGGMEALLGGDSSMQQAASWIQEEEKKFLAEKVPLAKGSRGALTWAFLSVALVSALSSLALRSRLMLPNSEADNPYSRIDLAPAQSSRELRLTRSA